MRWALFVGLLAVAGCKKEAPPPPPVRALGKLPEPKGDKAEVEISGTYKLGSTHPARVYTAVLDVPCIPVPAAPTVFGSEVASNEHLGIEVFVPQGTKGHICLYGLDAEGKVVAAAASEKNPMTMAGQGEVTAMVSMTLEPVAPVEPPKGLVFKRN